MLGFVPPDMDVLEAQLELLEAQVGGFYDPGGKTFYLMDACPKGIAGVILAHELGHALDDQLYDIDAGALARSQVTDRALAYHMVVEGSGTAVMTRWTVDHAGDLDIGALTEMQNEANAGMSAAPEYLWKPLLGSYMVGAAFLAKTDKIMVGQSSPGSNESIEAAFGEPPRSTEQALHPEKYWDAERIDEPTRVTVATDALPEGWNLLREDVLGELVLAILTTPEAQRGVDFSNPFAVIGIEYTNDAAAGWDGDACVLVGNGDARFLRLATVWDSERDAAEFYGAMLGAVGVLEAAAKQLGKRGHAEVRYGELPATVVLDVSLRSAQRTAPRGGRGAGGRARRLSFSRNDGARARAVRRARPRCARRAGTCLRRARRAAARAGRRSRAATRTGRTSAACPARPPRPRAPSGP